MVIITTKRLTLRHFRTEDAGELHAIFSNAKAMRYWSTPPHTSVQQTRDFVDKTIHATAAGAGNDFVVIHENRIIGKMGLWNNREIGFIFTPEAWGQGFPTEAIQAIINNSSSPAKITAAVDPRNSAAINLLIRNHFVSTGHAKNTLQVGEHWVDSQYFELVR